MTAERQHAESPLPKTNQQSVDPEPPVAEIETSGVERLQAEVGNQVVQRLLAQARGSGGGEGTDGSEVDEDIAERIQGSRGGGRPLDERLLRQLEDTLNFDLSQVMVHTSSDADALSQDLGAKAFTTGEDIFFRQGAYDPDSSSGQSLIAHEAAHVVQQAEGRVPEGKGLTVRPPGDTFEQEADAVASRSLSTGKSSEHTDTSCVQNHPEEMAEMRLQRQVEEDAEEEEEVVQAYSEGDGQLEIS